MSLFGPIILGIVALVCTVYLVKALLGGLVGNPLHMVDRLRFRLKERSLNQALELLKRKQQREALALLKHSFCFEQLLTSLEMIDAVHDHNLSVLSRFLSVAEDLGRQIDNLPVLEDLLLARLNTMRLMYEASRVRKQKDGDRSVPGWALTEYKKRVNELRDRLTTNQHSLETQIEALLSKVLDQPPRNEVTYH